jgi:hypothetical protein
LVFSHAGINLQQKKIQELKKKRGYNDIRP